MQAPRKTFYIWMRDLHLYTGLFISPFILLFAVSTLLLNHTWKPWKNESESLKTTVSVEIPNLEGIEQARAILRQVGVSGEIRNLFHRKNRLTIPVAKPDENMTVRVNLEDKTATIERQKTGFWDVLIYLHKYPGPHNANIRGNWIFTRIWRSLIDGTVCFLLFISASGIYLWAILRTERKTGLILIGMGTLSFVIILSTLLP